MSSLDQWKQIEDLFHASLAMDPQERSAYLDRECGSDASLRSEVESLLAASGDENVFMETPALSLGLRVMSETNSQRLVGQVLGHYKILKLLASGGMGDVYLAEDCTLERQVAVKFLSRGLVDNSWANAQFMREARAIAQLENPNICAIHGLEQIGEHSFIVMQYVEGETLDSLLTAGPLEMDQVLDFAEQIASALAAAHLRGIIHRDIKTQNIIVTPDGQIKVLDFGLAKFIKPDHRVETTGTPLNQTELGVVIGTVAYMSPEQAEGKELTSGTDVFSFGIVLYEMLTAKNPFLRYTKEATKEAIINHEPEPLIDLPANFSSIIEKSLAKKSEERFSDAGEILGAIRDWTSAQEQKAAAESWRPKYFRQYGIAACAILAILISFASYAYVKASKVHRLAMLPITNKSSDPNIDYLSEGLTRSLFEKFSYLPRLKVKLPTITMGNRSNIDPVGAGRALQADAVLSGELLKVGEVVKLHLTITNIDGRKMWEQTFDINPGEMLTLQDRITSQVTANLGLWLIGSERNLVTRKQTDDEEALRLYMNGRYFWSLKRDRDNILKAINYYEAAIERDHAYAKAYTGLADAYAIMSTVTYGPMSTKESMARAQWAVRQALEIDESAEAHTSMGMLKLRYDWDWETSEKEFKRAITLNPEYSTAHYWYANLLSILRRPDEAIKESQLARDLDPYSPLAAMNYGRALYYAGKFDEAEAQFRQLLENNSEYPQFLNMMGLVQIQQGKLTDAIVTLEKLHSINPLMGAAPLGYAYGKAGRPEESRKLLRELDELSKEKPVSPHEKAIIQMGLGDFDRAFELFEKSYSDRFAALAYLTTDPLYADLRSDFRFADLARRIGLNAYL